MSSTGASGTLAGSSQTVRIQVSFQVADERRAQTVTAKLIDSAHEIANLPECECDVDVSVEALPLEGATSSEDAGGAVPRGRPPKS